MRPHSGTDVTAETPLHALRELASRLNKMLPGSVVSFVLVYEAGTIWAHDGKSFGERKVKGRPWSGKSPHYITLFGERTNGHDGAIFTRTLTGSPPW